MPSHLHTIHWPNHELVKKYSTEFPDVTYLEDHIMSIPVSQDFNLNDMEYISDIINVTKKE